MPSSCARMYARVLVPSVWDRFQFECVCGGGGVIFYTLCWYTGITVLF